MNTTISRTLVTTLLALGAAPVVATTASADPTGAPNSFSFPTTCTNGAQVADLQFVVNSANGQGSGTGRNPRGQANFTPAHVVGSNAIYHPTWFDITFSFTPAGGGQTFTEHDTAAQPNGNRSVSCAIDYSQTDQAGNTFALKGTVRGWFS